MLLIETLIGRFRLSLRFFVVKTQSSNGCFGVYAFACRYCIALLDKFLLGSEGHSLARCVGDARSSCKMRHIVGLAPVCYGVPIHLAKS